MASSSEGSREIEAARKRLASAKTRASADAKALESAKEAEESARKTAEMATKSREDAHSRLHSSAKEVTEAETFLKGAEERWEVVAVDDSDDDELEEGSSRKKQKNGHAAVDEIVFEGCGVPGANGVYKLSSERDDLSEEGGVERAYWRSTHRPA